MPRDQPPRPQLLDLTAEPETPPDSGQIPFHQFADIFPLMEGARFDDLVTDIEANGLRSPVVMLNGEILDGRNRYLACLDAMVPPRFEQYIGKDPLGFVVSANLQRRHLNESQRAMVANRLATMAKGARTDRPNADPSRVSQPKAAASLNVSTRAVQAAAAITRSGIPELAKAVEHGDMAVSLAAIIAQKEPEEQKRIVNLPKKEQVELLRKPRKQVVYYPPPLPEPDIKLAPAPDAKPIPGVVLLEAPFDTEDVLSYVRSCMRDSLARGELPVLSVPNGASVSTVVYTDYGMTAEMLTTINASRAVGKTVEMRSIAPEET
jgi:hypothetical protein